MRVNDGSDASLSVVHHCGDSELQRPTPHKNMLCIKPIGLNRLLAVGGRGTNVNRLNKQPTYILTLSPLLPR